MTATSANMEMAIKAGFWARAGAAIIDGLILGVIGGILNQILGTQVGGGLSTLIGLVYYCYFWTTTQTPGNRVAGIRVIKKDGTRLDYVGGLIRYVGYFISAIPLGLGYWWMLWDAEKQCWHDKLAGTYVVSAASVPVESTAPTI